MMDQPAAAKIKSDDDLTNQVIGDFQVIRLIGQGGMGQVYVAEQTSLKRKVALKFLRPDLVANPTALNRFRAEAEAVARINHSNIVQVYMVGEHDGRHFMALEYVEGMNLRDYLIKKGALDLPRALLIMRQVAAALQRAGETGIVHRDIKPENILLTRKGEVKVTDFGLVRVFGNEQPLNVTQPGLTMGTPLYMSPEQVQGKAVDPRSDIYSFGVTCYHLLTGRPPFSGSNAIEVALKHVNDLAPPISSLRSDLPPELTQLIDWMMAKDPAKRPQTGREIIRLLNAQRPQVSDNPFIDLTAIPAPRANFPTPTDQTIVSTSTSALSSHFFGRRWLKFGIVAVLGLLMGGGLRLVFHTHDANAITSVPLEISDDERYLLREARQSWTYTTPVKMQGGFRVNVQLILLYLDQRRYIELLSLVEQYPESDPGLQFLRKFVEGCVYSFTDESSKALKSLQFAFGDRTYQKYLSYLGNPPSRESVDLRGALIDALDRLEKNGRLPPELTRVRMEATNFLRRPLGGPAGKKG
jgi:serine/threonine protein kinase